MRLETKKKVNLIDEITENNSKRDTVILHDEITDLVILLNSQITWEEFMETI